MSEKVGVYICHCGTNIAGVVDVNEVTRWASLQPNVAIAREYKFMCSSLGQELIISDIKEQGLTRVVVSACSPHLHEKTFRSACSRAGLNPYLLKWQIFESLIHGLPKTMKQPPTKQNH